jgi:hypothetical protein
LDRTLSRSTSAYLPTRREVVFASRFRSTTTLSPLFQWLLLAASIAASAFAIPLFKHSVVRVNPSLLHIIPLVVITQYGVANLKQANVIAVNVLGSNGSGTMSDVVGGVVWAVSRAFDDTVNTSFSLTQQAISPTMTVSSPNGSPSSYLILPFPIPYRDRRVGDDYDFKF